MSQTDFLVASPSFWSGMARVLDLGCTLPSYHMSETPEEADSRAIASDWANVGKDILAAMKEFANGEGY